MKPRKINVAGEHNMGIIKLFSPSIIPNAMTFIEDLNCKTSLVQSFQILKFKINYSDKSVVCAVIATDATHLLWKEM